MSRREKETAGSVPPPCAPDIDYAFVPAQTAAGIIGVKVWIYKGKTNMLLPKRTKFRKVPQGKIRGVATAGNYIAYGNLLRPGATNALPAARLSLPVRP